MNYDTSFIPDKELILLKRFAENSSWFFDNYKEIKEKYKEGYIAIFEKSIIDHDIDQLKLLDRLNKQYDNDLNDINIEYIYKEDPVFIL